MENSIGWHRMKRSGDNKGISKRYNRYFTLAILQFHYGYYNTKKNPNNVEGKLHTYPLRTVFYCCSERKYRYVNDISYRKNNESHCIPIPRSIMIMFPPPCYFVDHASRQKYSKYICKNMLIHIQNISLYCNILFSFFRFDWNWSLHARLHLNFT